MKKKKLHLDNMRGEVTFSGTCSFKNSADRSEEQQKEKNPHFYPEILLPAAGPHTIADGSDCTLTPLKRFTPWKQDRAIYTTKTAHATPKPPVQTAKLKAALSGWLSLLSMRPVIVKSLRSSPCSAPLHRGNPPQHQNKRPQPTESWI